MPKRRDGFDETRYRPGQSVNPTADLAIARADGLPPATGSSCPPPDREWVPQLYAELGSVAAVVREARLPRYKVLALLEEAGVEVKSRSRKSA